MSKKKRSIKRIILISIVVLIGLVGAFIPWPRDVKEYNKKDVVTHAVESLLYNRRVWTSSWIVDSSGWRTLLDSGCVKDNGRVYFRNELKIPDDVFLNLGLKPIPKDRKLDVNAGDVLLTFSYKGIEGKPTENIQFSYIFGSLGAQGYEIKVRRSLLLTYYLYLHKWIS
jgi:hypothetical protein